jgi:hypothetical protein
MDDPVDQGAAVEVWARTLALYHLVVLLSIKISLEPAMSNKDFLAV